MYRYDEFDKAFVHQRVKEFRQHINMRLDGSITEDEFKPLRLMNGLYLQLHAYMLRVAIPYGTLSSHQMRTLAFIAKEFDKGYGHFTTRQNIQYNWLKLTDVAELLETLADAEMHAIQTSGNCIRNITTDQWAGVAQNEVEDPRPIAEFLRQWSTLHPEFSFLPRKFKIAITGTPDIDRAAIRFHDIGLQALRHPETQQIGYRVFVGGGLGRTPMIATTIKNWIEKDRLLSYLEAIMRVYNALGRRDNKYKARIKILLFETGVEKFKQMVEETYAKDNGITADVSQEERERIAQYFASPPYQHITNQQLAQKEAWIHCKQQKHQAFNIWCKHNVAAHKQQGYSIVNISLKPSGGIPGDASSNDMYFIAGIADNHSMSEIRITHTQNLVLPYVKVDELFTVWQKLQAQNLAAPHHETINDIIACPGMDYCSLATARSIPVAQEISSRFHDIEYQHDIGEMALNISGCINACGHHHLGHIGILGLDKRGQEFYQLLLGGSSGNDASIGEIIGPGFSYEEIPNAVETVIKTYLSIRTDKQESFLATYRRVGEQPFKEALYGTSAQ